LAGKLAGQDPSNGGFEKTPYEEQETPPGMILIEGDSLPGFSRRVYSFYISSHEETNGQYLAYLTWMKKVYSLATYRMALPDTTVWLKENLPDSLKEYLIKNYLRGAAFHDYPVVGVSPEQVQKYAIWKTDRMNETILIREGLLEYVEDADSTNFFSTESYLAGKWSRQLKQKLPSFDEQAPERDVRLEDGIFLPNFRMATPDEWKFAALAVGDQNHSYIVTPKEASHQFDKGDHFGYLYLKPVKEKNSWDVVLLKRARADLHAVYNVPANPYKVYGMSGNVGEWVCDPEGNYFVMGNSWKDPGSDYTAPYDPLNKIYTIPEISSIAQERSTGPSAAIGFRLAMTYIDVPVGYVKTKKAKWSRRSVNLTRP
jgi:formylglycine-generating enzyme required for sulfatase activity